MRIRSERRDPPVEVTLPITPMLDMSFQLLFYFVMTFQAVNILEGQLDMYLPKLGNPQAKQPDQVDLTKDSDAELDSEAEITVVVTSTNGAIESLGIREKGRPQPEPVKDIHALQAVLANRKRDLPPNQSRIKIEADGKLLYAGLVQVMDACLAAGFKAVGFAPPPDLR